MEIENTPSPAGIWRYPLLIALAALAAGAVLRLIWLGDMEWKSDEVWMYQKSVEVAKGGPIPLIGMPSGAGGIVNPGLSVWVFAGLSLVSNSPVAMAAWVAILNILALIFFLILVMLRLPEDEKANWLWAIAFTAISVLPILFSRKIWAQCLLPPFAFLVLLGHFYRHKIWGALTFGFFGALIGQLHMSGFFFSAGLGLFTLISDIREARSPEGKAFSLKIWILILAGVLAGSLTLIPWLHYVLSHPGAGTSLFTKIKNIFSLKFYTHALATIWGLNIREYLGADFKSFSKDPYFFGKASYGVLLAHFALLVIGIAPLLKWVSGRVAEWMVNRAIRKSGREPEVSEKEESFESNGTHSGFYLSAAFLGMGMLLTLTGLNLHAHYLIALYPILFLLIPYCYPGRNRSLTLILLLQLFISVTFLIFIHRNGGAPNGDYGKSYKVQQAEHSQK